MSEQAKKPGRPALPPGERPAGVAVDRGVRRWSGHLAVALTLDSMARENRVYDLEDGDEVTCVHCQAENWRATYRKGEAFLAGPGHSPHDGNANYVCRDHLDGDAVLPGA